MIIQKRLIQITIIVVIFSMLLVFGLFQVAKGARFHQLNSLHLKYVVELKAQLMLAKGQIALDTKTIRDVVLNIKKQPDICLELINPLDRLIMKLINTDRIVQLCKNDIELANHTLSSLNNFENGVLTRTETFDILGQAAESFAENSAQVEVPISQTVDFIVASTLFVISALSLITIFTLVYAVRDISKSVKIMQETSLALEQSERSNKKLAHFDSLTGLPNRNLFHDRLNHQLNIAKRRHLNLVLLFIDLDQFKKVNDTMGHHAGDELICEAGKRLSDCIRRSDTVARIGGDEFNIILGDMATAEDSAIVAKKIVEQLAMPFTIMNQTVHISGSIGISTFPDDADNSTDLQKYADLAMYQAKEKGRNKFEFYSSQLDQMVTSRLKMEQRLRQALTNNEFTLYFQPVIDLKNMRICGVEALLRWHQPEVGMIPPVEFIPLAEETGLIVDIGEWVLVEACRAAKIWSRESLADFKVAVNVSPLQLRTENFVKSVERALIQYRLPPSALDIEITENLMIGEDSVSQRTLEELASLGISLLLDDFGTGHSSLSYLHKLPFNVLKIDRSFVFKMSKQKEKHNITASIIAMAHELDLKVVAEGLETNECLELLKSMECEYAQGYLFSRPVPAQEIDCNKVYSIEDMASID